MTPLRLRKVAYALLGSGSLMGGLFAMIGLLVGVFGPLIGPEMKPEALKGSALIIGISAAGLTGIVSGYVTIFGLPVADPARRLRLALGIMAGIIPCIVLLAAYVAEPSDLWLSIYVWGLPPVVGIALLFELRGGARPNPG